MTVLNTLFRPTGFTFRLAQIDAALFQGLSPVQPNGETNTRIKQLRRGGVRDLNLYIVRAIAGGVAGYACVSFLPSILPAFSASSLAPSSCSDASPS
jgi:hypothetical protein